MKYAFGAALAAFAVLAAAPAFAQTACPPMPATQPAVPDGATAKKSEIQAGEKAIGAWFTAMTAHMNCEKASIDTLKAGPDVAAYTDAVAKLKAVQDSPGVKDYQAKVEVYNSQADKMTKLRDAWEASVAAYNAKLGTAAAPADKPK